MLLYSLNESILKGGVTLNSSMEHLITDVSGYISELVPVNIDEVKNKLSSMLSDYHVTKVENEEVHPDLTQKVEVYLAAMKIEGLSPKTIEGYELELRLFVNKIKKKAENITTADIRTYLGSLQGVKMSTVGRKLYVLKSFFGWLVEEEYIDKNPTKRLKVPKVESRIKKSLTIEELELLRECCITLRERAMFEVFYSTGCRLDEIYKLNKDSFNIQTLTARVVGKGNKEREVYLSWKANFHLSKYLDSRTDDSEALFVSERKPHGRLSHRGMQREIKEIAKRAGLEDKLHVHSLRHTFATLMLNNGADLSSIQELLGHSSVSTTMLYAKTSNERKREQHKKYLVL